jgi:hypothetical protein
MTGCGGKRLVLIVGCLWLTAAPARAGQTRFHYVPVDAAGNTAVQPADGGAPGERVTRFGTVREPALQQARPTHLVTFRHPWTGRNVTVPLTLPEGTPRIEYGWTRIVYNYGSYTVEAQFCRDGSVDVVYDTGLLRRP